MRTDGFVCVHQYQHVLVFCTVSIRIGSEFPVYCIHFKLYQPKGRPRAARRHTCGFAGKIERIEGNRPLRVGKIPRNRATIALAKCLSTSSRVRTGFNGLSCSRSGWSERRASMIHDCAFFGVFFKFLAPTVRIPLFKCVPRGRHRGFEGV